MNDETTPGRPVGPPTWIPPAQAPTALPPQWTPPPGPPPPPPYGPFPGYGGFGPPPPRRSRVGLVVASGLALVLVVGIGVAGWLYATGRLGIGPLSAADEDAARAIVDGVERPAWAGRADVECAVDDLVHAHRSGGLEERGLVEHGGDDWTYRGEWRATDATDFYARLLECTGDWAEQVGAAWKLDDTDCLDDIGAETMSAWFAHDTLTLATGKEAVDEEAATAVEALDECYLSTPPAPEATARPAYRAVEFTFAAPEGDVVISTGGPGDWTPLDGSSTTVETEEGGAEACVRAQAVTTYPWGSTAEAEQELCGTAKPRRIWWKRLARCTAEPGCYAFRLHYAGFRDLARVTATFTSDGGSCMSVSGGCSNTVTALPGGRGTVVTWSFPGSYHGRFVARVGELTARIPN
ncbi:hypothetical protein [Nocardioides nitrophenolicus]|uniref:hypothetical protein n=1 Tax=Nocardioides nitrophenolicus TaxID=60489 RepID=UPI00195AD27F|nr:hypothetical protein [Nocardioides nitrophenolicus]MBM7518977.1 hypothetical protein [Nocardioides nitrophenolicus]